MQGIQGTVWTSHHSGSSQLVQHFEPLLSVLLGAASGCSWEWLNPLLWEGEAPGEQQCNPAPPVSTAETCSISAHTCLQWCGGGAGVASAPHRACSLSQTGAKALCTLEPLAWMAHRGRLLLVCVGLQSPRGLSWGAHTESGTDSPGEGAAGGECCH